ncbi:mechanosensitive ion channel family protein [Haloarcula litorea]|uniref:mechanosensitive ion channel family protein n=1 Tax=Haloarcula litorea TaxID=3032579 RepID=UPI0023E7A3DF|nr:mechanosensitive ion channel family protein [Halomicroarcula sp. GDY20]
MQATDTPTGSETSDAVVELVAGLQRFLEGLATTQGRAVATLLLLGLLVLGVVVVPVVLSRFRAAGVAWLESGRTAVWLDRLKTLTPTSFQGILLRTVQAAVLALVVVSFLVVWGLVDVVALVRPFAAGSNPWLLSTLQSLLVVALAFVLSDQLSRFVDRLSEALEDFTEHQEEIILRLGQVTIFVTAGASILTFWDQNVGGLLVGAGFLGIVVGFAARRTLGSLIAGFVLMFSRPFTIGDWVEIGDQEGIVTNITIFNTRLENFDGEFVVIPNDQVSDRAITNRSQKGLLRLTLDVGVDYDTDVERAADLAREAMTDLSELVDSPPPQVVPKSFGDSAVVLELRFWIDHPTPPRKWRAISAVVQSVKATFDEEGVSIPFPQRTLKTRGGSDLSEAVEVGAAEAED